MIFHALITHFDVKAFHLIEYFTFIFMYYVIYLLGFTVMEDKNSIIYNILFIYSTLHIIFSLFLMMEYQYWLSPDHLWLHINGEIFRIGSGIFMIWVFGTIKSPIPSKKTRKVTRLWQLVGVFIILIGLQTMGTVIQLMQDYRSELVTLNINFIGGLALLMISTVSWIVLKYPTAFIISHTQVFNALRLYHDIEEQPSEGEEPSYEVIREYISTISRKISDLRSFKDIE